MYAHSCRYAFFTFANIYQMRYTKKKMHDQCVNFTQLDNSCRILCQWTQFLLCIFLQDMLLGQHWKLGSRNHVDRWCYRHMDHLSLLDSTVQVDKPDICPEQQLLVHCCMSHLGMDFYSRHLCPLDRSDLCYKGGMRWVYLVFQSDSNIPEDMVCSHWIYSALSCHHMFRQGIESVLFHRSNNRGGKLM